MFDSAANGYFAVERVLQNRREQDENVSRFGFVDRASLRAYCDAEIDRELAARIKASEGNSDGK